MSKNTCFLISMFLLIVVMSGLTILVKSYFPQFVTPCWGFILFFFAIVNIVIYLLTMKIKEKKDMGKFTNFYMATTMTKLLVYLAILLIYVLIFPEDKKAFIFTFLAYYLCFTFFETYILTKSRN